MRLGFNLFGTDVTIIDTDEQETDYDFSQCSDEDIHALMYDEGVDDEIRGHAHAQAIVRRIPPDHDKYWKEA